MPVHKIRTIIPGFLSFFLLAAFTLAAAPQAWAHPAQHRMSPFEGNGSPHLHCLLRGHTNATGQCPHSAGQLLEKELVPQIAPFCQGKTNSQGTTPTSLNKTEAWAAPLEMPEPPAWPQALFSFSDCYTPPDPESVYFPPKPFIG